MSFNHRVIVALLSGIEPVRGRGDDGRSPYTGFLGLGASQACVMLDDDLAILSLLFEKLMVALCWSCGTI